MKLTSKQRAVLAVCRNAKLDGDRGASWVNFSGWELRTIRALESFGYCKATPTGAKLAGLPEYNVKITDAGMAIYEAAVA